MANSLIIPPFSTPTTRTDFTNVQNMLIAFFQNYGFSPSDAASDAGTVINLQGQGYSLTDIATIILGYHQTLENVASNNALAAASSVTASEPKMQANAAIASTIPAQTPISASTSNPNAGNVSLTLVFRNRSGQVQNNFTITNVVTAADYQSVKSALAAAYGSRVAIQSVSSTNSPVTIDASALAEQADITVSLIDQTPINNPTTEGGTLNGANVTQPVQFNIILPNGSSQNNVILSPADYIQLQNNVGIFTISNATQGNYTPNTTYSQLLAWMNGGTPLASTQNGKTTNNATDVTDLTKTPSIATATPTITKIILAGGSGGFWDATLIYSDNSQQNYSLSTKNVINDLASSGAQLVDNTNGLWSAATGSPASLTNVPAYIPSTSDVNLSFTSVEISGNSINFDIESSDVNPQALGQKATLVVTLDNNQSQIFAVTVGQAGGSSGQFANAGVGSHTLSALLLLGSQQTGFPMSNVATGQVQIVAPSSSTPTPAPATTPIPVNNPLADALASVEKEVSTFISTAETNVNGLISKVTGVASSAASSVSSASSATVAAIQQGAGAAANAITQAAQNAGNTINKLVTPTPAPATTPTPKIIKQITITSKIDSANWGVVLLYSDGTTQGYSLSTQNILNDLATGATLIDKSGLWGKTSTKTSTTSTIISKAKQYTLPIILAISAASGIFVAFEMSRKRGIEQHV